MASFQLTLTTGCVGPCRKPGLFQALLRKPISRAKTSKSCSRVGQMQKATSPTGANLRPNELSPPAASGGVVVVAVSLAAVVAGAGVATGGCAGAGVVGKVLMFLIGVPCSDVTTIG